MFDFIQVVPALPDEERHNSYHHAPVLLPPKHPGLQGWEKPLPKILESSS